MATVGARSLSGLFKTVFDSNVQKFNTFQSGSPTSKDPCALRTLPDGSVVQNDPVECQRIVTERNLAAKSSWDQVAAKALSVFAGSVPVIGTASSLAIKGATVLQDLGQAPFVAQKSTLVSGGKPMGLFDDIWGGIQQGVQGIFPTNQGIDWNSLLSQGVGLATTALAPRGSSTMVPSMQPTSLAGAVPMAARGGALALAGRGLMTRFPNLAGAIASLRNSGMNVTRAKLYGVMKRFGPEFLISGGLLTAAAVQELAVAGPGYRRMNPANVRALRRSVRRIESFHRLCKTTDSLRSRRRK